jgi:hypothetical protein
VWRGGVGEQSRSLVCREMRKQLGQETPICQRWNATPTGDTIRIQYGRIQYGRLQSGSQKSAANILSPPETAAAVARRPNRRVRPAADMETQRLVATHPPARSEPSPDFGVPWGVPWGLPLIVFVSRHRLQRGAGQLQDRQA